MISAYAEETAAATSYLIAADEAIGNAAAVHVQIQSESESSHHSGDALHGKTVFNKLRTSGNCAENLT